MIWKYELTKSIKHVDLVYLQYAKKVFEYFKYESELKKNSGMIITLQKIFTGFSQR